VRTFCVTALRSLVKDIDSMTYVSQIQRSSRKKGESIRYYYFTGMTNYEVFSSAITHTHARTHAHTHAHEV